MILCQYCSGKRNVFSKKKIIQVYLKTFKAVEHKIKLQSQIVA